MNQCALSVDQILWKKLNKSKFQRMIFDMWCALIRINVHYLSKVVCGVRERARERGRGEREERSEGRREVLRVSFCLYILAESNIQLAVVGWPTRRPQQSQ